MMLRPISEATNTHTHTQSGWVREGSEGARTHRYTHTQSLSSRLCVCINTADPDTHAYTHTHAHTEEGSRERERERGESRTFWLDRRRGVSLSSSIREPSQLEGPPGGNIQVVTVVGPAWRAHAHARLSGYRGRVTGGLCAEGGGGGPRGNFSPASRRRKGRRAAYSCRGRERRGRRRRWHKVSFRTLIVQEALIFSFSWSNFFCVCRAIPGAS